MSGIESAFFGALGADAESKVSKAGKSYMRLRVRVGDGDGAQWVSVMCFDPDAIAAADKLVKGARLYVEGRISLDEWTGQDGSARHGLSCLSWHTRLSQIGRQKPKREHDDGNERPAQRQAEPALNDEIPF
jgi:single-stranded DNA-binding protein